MRLCLCRPPIYSLAGSRLGSQNFRQHAMSSETGDKMKKSSAGRTLAAGSIGNFGEIYDFAVFGFSVPMLSLHFFPGTDRTAALLSTFAVYAVAFFARPGKAMDGPPQGGGH